MSTSIDGQNDTKNSMIILHDMIHDISVMVIDKQKMSKPETYYHRIQRLNL